MNMTAPSSFRTLLFIFLLLAATLPGAGQNPDEQAFRDRANLAMRAVAHRMLLINGDTLSAIPPVQYTNRQYRVRLHDNLRYDTLRVVADQIFKAHGLPLAYDLVVYDCTNQAIVLGFTALPANRVQDVPCQERDPITKCVDFGIRFHSADAVVKQSSLPNWWWWVIAPLLLAGGVFLGNKVLHKQPVAVQAVNQLEEAVLIRLGAFTFHSREQWLAINGKKKELTYREAKLLSFFCLHPNEILLREKIIDSVWGEEGVQVTRSLDVFVSRLRKMLKADPSVQITSIHGVGYRLSISAPAESRSNGGFRWPENLLNHFKN